MEATAISAIAALIGVVLGRALDRGHWLRGQKLEAYVNLMQLSSLIHSRLKSEPPQDVTLEQLEISDPLFEQFDRARAAAFAVASHELITPINDIVRILRLECERSRGW